MPYEAYGQQVANNIQTAYSDFLMGMREGRAMREQSLREKAFEQEQKKAELQFQAFEQEKELRNLQINQAKRLLDLERVTALGSSGAQSQFEKLQSAAVNEDYDTLRRASYTDVQLEGADPEALAKFNNAQREAFRIQKANALSASAGQKNRLQDINSLTEYSLTLAEDPVRRGYADEARALLQAGIPISQLGAEHAQLLNEAGKYAAQKAMASNPTYAAKTIDLLMEKKKQDRLQLKEVVDKLEKEYEIKSKTAGSAAQSGNQKLYEQAAKDLEAAKAAWDEASVKLQQYDQQMYSKDEVSNMLQSSVTSQAAKQPTYMVTIQKKGDIKPRQLELTKEQYDEAVKYNGSKWDLIDWTFKSGK